MKFTVLFICLLSAVSFESAARKAAKFVLESVDQRSDINVNYKRIGTSSYFGLFGRNSRTQCSEVCLNEDSCESFYMEGGACVFGVSGDNTAFAEGETANPNSEQRIQVIGMCFFSEQFNGKPIYMYKLISFCLAKCL